MPFADPDKIREYQRNYMRLYRLRDLEKARAQGRVRNAAYRAKYPERVRATSKKYADSTPGYRRAQHAAHRVARKSRTPRWADRAAIRAIYANCPEGFHVDHVIPLRGKWVSGLHVEVNLQYLPSSENQRKSNKY
jgi:hypothetical protein